MNPRQCKAGPLMSVYCWTLMATTLLLLLPFAAVAHALQNGWRDTAFEARLFLSELAQDYRRAWRDGINAALSHPPSPVA